MGFSILLEVAAAVAVTALLAEGYGMVRRRLAHTWVAPYLLGFVFGLLALVQMNNPIEPFDGLILDLRNIPIALAGAFLGWRGLLPCLAMAMAMRFSLGGVGMESGLFGMLLAGCAGLVWAWKMKGRDDRSFASLLVLAVAMSSHLIAALILPYDIAVWFITTAAVPMFVLNMISVPLLAALLERENRRIRHENKLSASVTHDPVSGLLLGPAFIREMANAYTARPMGTFAGFLTITPERGIWRSARGLFGEPAPVALDRQAMAMHLEHAELAGLCADGRILVPLSIEEVHEFSRVRANLTLALRNTPAAANGDAVNLSMRAVPDPTEFFRITESAAIHANVDWKAAAAIGQQAKAPAPESRFVQRANVFNRKEHDILFAKADFLMIRRKRYAP